MVWIVEAWSPPLNRFSSIPQEQSMAGEEVPRSILCREGPCRLLALLGASVVVLTVVGKPSAHAGYALAGFLLWLLGVARLLLFGQTGMQHPVFPGALAAATAKLAVKLKHFFFGRQEPAAAPA